MHHFTYPSQDTYITNLPNKDILNFGLDEILRVGTIGQISQIISPTTTFTLTNQTVGNFCVTLFSGSLSSASFTATASALIGSASLITGSSDGFPNISASFGSFTNFSGSAVNFFGSASHLSGQFTTAILSGTYTVVLAHEFLTSSIFFNRALVQFDISAISQSIASGDIPSPQFRLKLKLAKGENLPINYTLYAFPLSETWVMGNGYEANGGSQVGASWVFRDQNFGTLWTVAGGTHITPAASQSFNYQAGDIDMDVTAIVNTWLSGSPNDGFIIVSGDEFNPTGSGMQLSFFSNDSNTIYRPVLDVAWSDVSLVTGSTSTGSVVISTRPPELTGSIVNNPTITGSIINGTFGGVMNVLFDSAGSGSGTVTGTGQDGTISGSSIFGSVSGSVTQSIVALQTVVYLPGNAYGVTSPSTTVTTFVTTSVFQATFQDGFFSGSFFTASISNMIDLVGQMTGSWNTSQLLVSQISGSFPFLNYPTLFAQIQGPYIHGNSYGAVSAVNGTGSAIFSGTIIDGPLIGSYVVLPFSGSISTASFSFTSSVTISSSSLQPLELNSPFVTVIQGLRPNVKAGNIIRVNVFGREEFPLKNFARSTQFSQFLTPKYLPSSSYYAIKDNQTEEIVLDFDNYTQISCDTNGNYFLLDTTGLPQERYFKILIRTEQSGSSYTIDNGDVFKIVR